MPFGVSPATYPGTNIPVGASSSEGWSAGMLPGVVPVIPTKNSPGITMDDAVGGARYSPVSKSSGDVTTWDSILDLTSLVGNVYVHSRQTPGSVPATPDQRPSRTRPDASNQVSPPPSSSSPITPETTSTNRWIWWAILAFLMVFVVAWLAMK